MKHFLFFTRLGLYLLAVSLPFLHPAVVVPYDRVGIAFWFVLVPLEMAVAFYLAPPRLSLRYWLGAAAAPIVLFVLAVAGFELGTLLYVLGAAAAFVLTVLVFRAQGTGRGVAVAEPFALGVIYLRLLGFSRASEELARQSSGLTQLIMTLIPLAFLLHSLVLYLALFRPRGRRGLREVGLFLAAALPVFFLLSFVLPADFVRRGIVFNRIDRDIKPKPVPLDAEGRGWENGNLRSPWEGLNEGGRGRRDGTEGGDGQRNALEGIPADQWGSGTGQGEGQEGKQYAVMVIASPVQPIYAASAYFGDFDAERGLLLTAAEPLNELAYLRFLETWRDPLPPADVGREPVEIHTISTLPERYLPFRPYAIEPTVLKRQYYPFEYSYRSVSRISQGSCGDWARLGELTAAERLRLEHYLEVPLDAALRQAFTGYLEQALGGASGYYQRLDAILRSFSAYQWEVGFDDDTSVAKMERFLFTTKRGDCTEFSNTAAILFRLAGIPSRVVTGYLADRSLESFAHLQALFNLREAIPALKEFPIADLHLVTTAQRHSWVQAYLPGYGWVDFESTAFAIPPPPGRNPGNLDVVIPLIQNLGEEPQPLRFPWLLAGELLALLALVGLAGIYLFRYGREAYLAVAARGQDERALRALWALLLDRLCTRGLALKPPSQTPLEYAREYPQLERFASLYTMLRYREGMRPEERLRAWSELRACYREALASTRRPGLGAALRRLFSLRALYYL